MKFWGVRGSHTAPYQSHLGVGGNTSCVEFRTDDHTLVCDAGTGIIPFGQELVGRDAPHELLLVLTHYHWDHICGLPFFVPAFIPDWDIKVFGPGADGNDVERCIAEQMKAPYFPVETERWLADIHYCNSEKGILHHGPFTIQHQNVHHPGVTYGYKITAGDKSVAYISDNECFFLEKSIKERADDLPAEEKAVWDQLNEQETETELAFIRDIDILIHDAQYTPDDYSTKRGWGHSCFFDAVRFAIQANVKTLYLFHHDPSYDDDKIAEIEAECRHFIEEQNSSLICLVAREGMTVKL